MVECTAATSSCSRSLCALLRNAGQQHHKEPQCGWDIPSKAACDVRHHLSQLHDVVASSGRAGFPVKVKVTIIDSGGTRAAHIVGGRLLHLDICVPTLHGSVEWH